MWMPAPTHDSPPCLAQSGEGYGSFARILEQLHALGGEGDIDAASDGAEMVGLLMLDGHAETHSSLGTHLHSETQTPSQLGSAAPPPGGLADTRGEARRAAEGEAAWRCLAEQADPPPASPPHPQPLALGGQHRGYKRLASQAQQQRGLKSSVSLDSLRPAFPRQSLHSFLPPRRLSSTATASIITPAATAAAPSSSSPSSAREIASPAPAARQSGGVDKKSTQSSLLRRRPSAQLLSSASLLDRLKLEDGMSSHPMGSMDDMTAHGQQQILSKYNTDMSSYAAPLPLSPPPSATRPDFMTSSNSYHVSEDGGMSFGGSELGITRPHSMSSLRGASSYTNGNHAEDGVRRLSDPYQSLEPVAESSMYIRHPQHGCWTPQDWMNEIPTSMDMGMMDPTPSQSPTAQQWADEQAEAENRAHMQLRMSNENGMPVMVGGIAHPLNSFRLALPPSGRNVQRMPSCPNFRAPSAAGYHLQEPPSPAQEDHELSHYSGYVGRSRSTSSSMPSPPESPDFYFSTNPQHRSGGYPSTPLPGQETFPQDVYGMASLNSNAMPRANVHHRPTRASSRGVPSSAAAKSSSKRSKSRSARRVSGHTNLRNQSRNGSIASRGGLGIGSDNSEMSFVNFTPQDATRILSGVAPSGSSKTKARREREALEKRRKLSEAAAAAVMAAGGDASQLPGLLTI